MMRNSNGGLLDKKIFASKVKSANVKKSEMLFGFLLGPFGALITSAVFGAFLNRFYTDILDLTNPKFGSLITILPLISTVFVVAANLFMGIIIDKTKTKQGKARPFLLLSAPLIALACILMFAVPENNVTLEIIWIIISYNLFFSVAYPIYYMSHSMMIPLSTRNTKQRGMLSVVTNLANLGAAGFFAAIVFPLIVSNLTTKLNWLTVMSVIGAISLVAIFLEYYFTRERISEESMNLDIEDQKIPLKKQLKAVINDKYWWIIIVFYLLFQFGGAIKNFSMIYFCQYIVTSSVDVGLTQSILAILSGLPMAIGVVIVWPLANKIGKKNLTVIGLALSVVGGVIAMLAPKSFVVVVIGVTIKALGSVPACYIMMALFADVLDHLEAKNGYRCDGLSMSLYSAIMVALGGICIGLFNGMLSKTGYLAPIGGIYQPQNVATEQVFIWGYIGIELVAYAIVGVLLLFLNVEKHIVSDQKIILERQKAEVIASGGIWIEPEERARLEEEENDRQADLARQQELKTYCNRKGLIFEKEEIKYQEKLKAKIENKKF